MARCCCGGLEPRSQRRKGPPKGFAVKRRNFSLLTKVFAHRARCSRAAAQCVQKSPPLRCPFFLSIRAVVHTPKYRQPTRYRLRMHTPAQPRMPAKSETGVEIKKNPESSRSTAEPKCQYNEKERRRPEQSEKRNARRHVASISIHIQATETLVSYDYNIVQCWKIASRKLHDCRRRAHRQESRRGLKPALKGARLAGCVPLRVLRSALPPSGLPSDRPTDRPSGLPTDRPALLGSCPASRPSDRATVAELTHPA